MATAATPQSQPQRPQSDRRAPPNAGAQPNHLQRQPLHGQAPQHGFNIRALDFSQLEELSAEIHARMDELMIGLHPPAEEEDEELADIPEEEVEDFQEHEG